MHTFLIARQIGLILLSRDLFSQNCRPASQICLSPRTLSSEELQLSAICLINNRRHSPSTETRITLPLRQTRPENSFSFLFSYFDSQKLLDHPLLFFVLLLLMFLKNLLTMWKSEVVFETGVHCLPKCWHLE